MGKGNGEVHCPVITKEEIGTLAESFNRMTVNLQRTLTGRDNLGIELSLRKKAEEEIKRELEEKEILIPEAAIILEFKL